MKKIQIIINKPILNYKVGQIVSISANEHNVPKDIYWRRRFNDAKIDNCLEFYNAEIKSGKKQQKNMTKQNSGAPTATLG